MARNFSETEYCALLGRLFLRFPSFGSNGSEAYKPGLEREEEFCRRLGNPQNKFQSIHVAGTNGKGSTCNLLTAQLSSEGAKVGLYTSPHILDFRERMRIVSNDTCTLISKQEVWDFLTAYNADFDELDLSLFEITTAMAFDYFARHEVDVAVIETGLGGRLDATNIITPTLSVITNIGYDHMNILGDTLAEIAGEKAGIIKPGIPVVIGESGAETDPVFEAVAQRSGSPLTYADCEPEEVGEAAALAKMDLPGIYQKKNLRTVSCAIKAMGHKVNFDALEKAAATCDFHGRWEKVSDSPATICDIGHNAHGLKYNFKQLNDLLDCGEYSDLVMVYGSVNDKDVEAVLRLLPSRAHIFFTAADSKRAMPAEWLMSHSNVPDARVTPRVADAVSAAIGLCAGLKRPILYIGGSTYVVSEALEALKDKR